MLITAAVRRVTELPLDVHLMIERPERFLDAFVEAGAEMVTVHQEVDPHLNRTLNRLHELGAKAGVALNPATPLGSLDDVIELADYVLLMSVNPGFGGQRLIPRVLEKARRLRELAEGRNPGLRIGIDGGVDARADRADPRPLAAGVHRHSGEGPGPAGEGPQGRTRADPCGRSRRKSPAARASKPRRGRLRSPR